MQLANICSVKFQNPHQLPVKVCELCLKPFTWRKKWEKNWDAVKYCSERCRRQKKS